MEIRRQKKHACASLPPATCLNRPTLPKCSATGQISSAPGQAKFGTSQLLCGPRHCMPQGGRPLLHAMPCRDKPCVVCHMPKPVSTSHVLPVTAKPMSAAGHVLPQLTPVWCMSIPACHKSNFAATSHARPSTNKIPQKLRPVCHRQGRPSHRPGPIATSQSHSPLAGPRPARAWQRHNTQPIRLFATG